MDTAKTLSFKCRRCGACCRVLGYVFLDPSEPDIIAAHLGMEVAAFIEKHTEVAPDRRGLVLKSLANGTCEMLDSNNQCTINDVKPRQCRSFPFEWRNPDSDTICPAISGAAAP